MSSNEKVMMLRSWPPQSYSMRLQANGKSIMNIWYNEFILMGMLSNYATALRGLFPLRRFDHRERGNIVYLYKIVVIWCI